VILKDHEGDVGQIPSNLGGEPWWASNDIIIVAAGSARPDCITPARGIPLVANESYDVYVRAHNTGCQAMESIRAAVYAATPGTMMTDLHAISDDGVYSGGSDGPQTAQPGDCAIIGKFPWTPTQAELGGADDGHRCLLAAITSDLDPGPAVDPSAWVPAEHDNVTQRNIQVSSLEYFIRNATSAAASSELVLDMGAFPAGTSGASFKFFVDDPNAELDPIWQGTPGVVISRDGSNVVVDVQAGIVTLPAFPMPAVSARASRVEFTLPFDSGPYRVVLTHRLDGVDVGGMIFDLSGPRTPH
jgi:hypothetical protein